MKNRGKKTLGNILKMAGVGAIMSFMPMKSEAQRIVNPFVQPNQENLNWYGSGDVNNDNTVDWNDVSKMEEIIDSSYVPNLESDDVGEYRTLDRADVNGDGVVSLDDKQLLENKLNGEVDYLPGHWDELQTKSEREDWLTKMLEVDKTDTTTYFPEGFICTDFARQTMLNFHGFPELGYNESEGLRDNGRFNIPMMYVSTIARSGGGHAINVTMTGDNLKNFEDGYYTEPQADWQVTPGSQSMHENGETFLKSMGVKNNPSQGTYLSSLQLLIFDLIDGNPEIEWVNDTQSFDIFFQRDTTPPEISRSSPLENELYKNPKLDWNVEDETFKEAKYSVNGGSWKELEQSGNENLNLNSGEHNLVIKAEDYFGNVSKDSVNFSVDNEFEKLSIYNPKPDTTIEKDDVFLEYELKDKNLDLENSYYVLNGDKKYFTDSIGSVSLNSKEGLNELEVIAMDKLGNSKSEKINYTYDDGITSTSETSRNSERSKFYPNPVSETGTFEYVPGGKDLSIEIYSASGKKLDEIVDKDNDGKVQHSFSDYPPGVYFYRSSDGGSGKILKD